MQARKPEKTLEADWNEEGELKLTAASSSNERANVKLQLWL